MYAVIKTGGKQYRVQAGDVLVVEKLAGDAGAEISFGEVLMLGDGDVFELGAPLIDGAAVTATLIETRRADKIKVFKKIRRQGYRRTQGHRQAETVLRVTGIAGAGKESKWDGTVDMTTKAVLNARSRNLKHVLAAAEAAPTVAEAAPAAPKKASTPKVAKADTTDAASKAATPEAAAKKPAADEA